MKTAARFSHHAGLLLKALKRILRGKSGAVQDRRTQLDSERGLRSRCRRRRPSVLTFPRNAVLSRQRREISDKKTLVSVAQCGWQPALFDVPKVGGPVRVAWREVTLTRAAELEALCAWMRVERTKQNDNVLIEAVGPHLEAAREVARVGKLKQYMPRIDEPLIERARSNLDAAEVHLLNLAPREYLLGQMPSLLRHVQCNLSPTDPRRQEFERLARRLGIKDPDHPLIEDAKALTFEKELKIVEHERRRIAAIVRGASSAALREHIRLRSFRSVVVMTCVLMTILMVGVGIVGWLEKTWIPLCFTPEEAGIATVVCPTGRSERFKPASEQQQSTPEAGAQQQSDVQVKDIDDMVEKTVQPQDLLVVEGVGLAAAAISAAAAIRHIRGSSERYGLLVSLALLKLPTGAITAFLGLLLMRGQFVPGLSALDTSAQILAWALVFGYAQQLFTRLVDQQGQTVLNNVRGADKTQPGTSSD